ncbi:hypothetical protein [Sebaldella sp. S0638]|nr:hypothetical protein [Sebaldella sp. S0638]MCP1225327.1 hypothetical protein [Sebaldella sp. S0638]
MKKLFIMSTALLIFLTSCIVVDDHYPRGSKNDNGRGHSRPPKHGKR